MNRKFKLETHSPTYDGYYEFILLRWKMNVVILRFWIFPAFDFMHKVFDEFQFKTWFFVRQTNYQQI